ncbi:MAG: hypothetical protein IJT38_04170 [Clostridia bacterium]|nr:hypothetical protein [Clostridia bacterium]
MKKKSLSFAGVAASLLLLVASSIIAEHKIIDYKYGVALTAFSVLLVLISAFFASKYDYETGLYECKNCDHRFKPTLKAYILGPHTLASRYLKCPKCSEKSWCKRRDIFDE